MTVLRMIMVPDDSSLGQFSLSMKEVVVNDCIGTYSLY